MIALVQWRFGANTRRFPVNSFPDVSFEVLGARVSLLQVAIAAVALGLMLALTWLPRQSGCCAPRLSPHVD